MPFDLADVLAPDHTAVITVEIERGVIGDLSFSPELTDAADKVDLVPNAVRLVQGARARTACASCTRWPSCERTAPASASTTA